MKLFAIIGLLLLICFGACTLCGCGHQPAGIATSVAIFGQVESYSITHIYYPNAIKIEAAAQAAGLKNPGGQGIPELGIGNGSTAYIFGPTIWGYQGYKAPKNSNPIGKMPV